jgi:hypothetical protein
MGVRLETIQDTLMAALRASKFWTVLPATDANSICLLEMKVRA